MCAISTAGSLCAGFTGNLAQSMNSFKNKKPQVYAQLFQSRDISPLLASYCDLEKSSNELQNNQPLLYRKVVEAFDDGLKAVKTIYRFPQDITIRLVPFFNTVVQGATGHNEETGFAMYFINHPISLVTGECFFAISEEAWNNLCNNPALAGFTIKHEIGHALQYFTEPIEFYQKSAVRDLEREKFAKAVLANDHNFDYVGSHRKITFAESFADTVAINTSSKEELDAAEKYFLNELMECIKQHKALDLLKSFSQKGDRIRFCGIIDRWDYRLAAKEAGIAGSQNTAYDTYRMILNKKIRDAQKKSRH